MLVISDELFTLNFPGAVSGDRLIQSQIYGAGSLFTNTNEPFKFIPETAIVVLFWLRKEYSVYCMYVSQA